jgi:hypothetical protein
MIVVALLAAAGLFYAAWCLACWIGERKFRRNLDRRIKMNVTRDWPPH